MTPDLVVTVNGGDRTDVPVRLLEDAVRRSALACGANAGEFSVTLLDDAEIRGLNDEYLGHDRPTDVISFSLGDDERPLGDIYVGYDRAVTQSNDAGVPLAEELARLTIHGVLHVLGHDHPDGVERLDSPMFELQERLLRELFGD